MPFLKIQTNHPVPGPERPALLRMASSAVAELLGKPERYVMVVLEVNTDMLFAGEDTPLAYLELKSLGLPESRTGELSARLCALMGELLDIDPGRVYIEFAVARRHLWGWDGGTF